MPFRQLPGARLCCFKKGDILISDGEPISCLYYLIDGLVYREIITESGNETIVNMKTTKTPLGALVGLLILYREDQISTSTFVAKTDCTCYKIPKESYLAMADKDPQIMKETLKLMMKEFVRLTDLYNGKREGDAASRLCQLLLEHSQSEDGRIIVPTQWSNMEMAKYLGVHSVTISRILKALKQNRCLYRSGAVLVISDWEKVTDYAQRKEPLNYK